MSMRPDNSATPDTLRRRAESLARMADQFSEEKRDRMLLMAKRYRDQADRIDGACERF